MKNKRLWIILGGIALLIGALVVGHFVTSNNKEDNTVAYEIHEVRTEDPLIFDGQVRASEHQVVISPGPSTQIEEVLVEDGQNVQEGDDLIRISQSSNEELPPMIDQDQEETITANFSGIVQLNQEAIDQEGASQSPWLEVISENVEIVSSVSEYDYENLEEGQTVTVELMNSDRQVEGEITEIALTPSDSFSSGGGFDQDLSGGMSGELPVESSDTAGGTTYSFVVEPNDTIHYGYSVQVSLDSNQIVIPESSVVGEEGEYGVFLVEGGIAKKQPVEGQINNEVFEVNEGLEEGQKIVLDPDEDLRDGQEVGQAND